MTATKTSFADSKKKVQEMGYDVFSRTSSTWTFSKNGVRSVLGFDREAEVIDFILENEPDPTKIFPPYK